MSPLRYYRFACKEAINLVDFAIFFNLAVSKLSVKNFLKRLSLQTKLRQCEQCQSAAHQLYNHFVFT